MVKVGVIGPGPMWETRYRPALERLGRRIGVCAVYDPVMARAVQIAADWRAAVAPGVVALATNPGLQAILLLDAGWPGPHLVELISECQKPIYLAGSLGQDWSLLKRLEVRAAAHRLTLMPEFTLRHTPSTARLHELMATKLGRPREIAIDAVSPSPDDPLAAVTGSGNDFLVGLIDWCRYVVRTTPVRVESRGPEALEGSVSLGTEIERQVVIEFARSRAGGDPPRVTLTLRRPAHPGAAADPNRPGEAWVTQEVRCEGGRATIRSSSEICWTNGAATPTTEVLTSDRSAVEVMLDHFCRRVVGGLIPVADIHDVCRSVAVVSAADESRQRGESVALA